MMAMAAFGLLCAMLAFVYGAAWGVRREEALSRVFGCERCREKHCCPEGCGEPATDVDHIIRRVEGGNDVDSNLQALAHQCHSRKTAREVLPRGRQPGRDPAPIEPGQEHP